MFTKKSPNSVKMYRSSAMGYSEVSSTQKILYLFRSREVNQVGANRNLAPQLLSPSTWILGKSLGKCNLVLMGTMDLIGLPIKFPS